MALRMRPVGAVAVPWTLIRVALVVGVVGLVGYDTVSVAATTVQADDTAGTIATDASASWHQTKDRNAAFRVAADEAAQHDLVLRPEDFAIAPDGRVTLSVSTTAHTLLLHRVRPLRAYADVSADASRNDELS